MSQPKKKKVVEVKSKDSKSNLKPTNSKRRSDVGSVKASKELLFTAESYKWVALGILLIALGMILMLGGSMPSADVWDESLIYSLRRTLIAPIFILAGLGIQIYALLKK